MAIKAAKAPTAVTKKVEPFTKPTYNYHRYNDKFINATTIHPLNNRDYRELANLNYELGKMEANLVLEPKSTKTITANEILDKQIAHIKMELNYKETRYLKWNSFYIWKHRDTKLASMKIESEQISTSDNEEEEPEE